MDFDTMMPCLNQLGRRHIHRAYLRGPTAATERRDLWAAEKTPLRRPMARSFRSLFLASGLRMAAGYDLVASKFLLSSDV